MNDILNARIIHASLVLVTCVFAFSCERKPNAKPSPDRVTLLLDWKAGTEHAFVFYGIERGYFADEGIEVQVLPSKGSSDSIAQVNAKSVDFGIAAGESVLTAVAADDPRNIGMIACFYWTTPTEIFSLKAKGITKPTDLYGKTIGVVRGSSGYRNYVAFAQHVGLDTSRIKEVASTGDLREIIAPNAEVDALVQFFYQEPLQLKLKQFEINEIRLADHGVQVYGQGLIAHSDTMRTRASLVRRFTRAIQKSWRATLAEPDKAVGVFLRDNPGASREYSLAKAKAVVEFVRNGMKQAGVHIVGEQTDAGWRSTYEYLKAQKMLRTDVTAKAAWTNAYLDKSITIP